MEDGNVKGPFPCKPEVKSIVLNQQTKPTILRSVLVLQYSSTIASSLHVKVPHRIQPGSYRFDISITTNASSLIISKSTRYRCEDTFPDWHNLQSRLFNKIISCTSQVADKIEYQFKYFDVIFHECILREKMGQIMIQKENC